MGVFITKLPACRHYIIRCSIFPPGLRCLESAQKCALLRAKGLVTLHKGARDKEFDCFVKREKRKQAHRMCYINRRHKVVEELKINAKFQQLKQTLNGQYNHNQNQLHTIQFSDKGSHALTCTCLDSILQYTICKHIHLVVMRQAIYHVNEYVVKRVIGNYLMQFLNPYDRENVIQIFRHRITTFVQL